MHLLYILHLDGALVMGNKVVKAAVRNCASVALKWTGAAKTSHKKQRN